MGLENTGWKRTCSVAVKHEAAAATMAILAEVVALVGVDWFLVAIFFVLLVQ